MKQLLKLFLMSVWAISSVAVAQTSTQPANALPSALRIGIVPNVSTSVLMANYTPLKDFFVAEGLRQTTLLTADNFIAFNEQTSANAYDVVITAPHMARLAQVDYKYVPLMAMSPNIRALMITSGAANASVAEIKNSQVAYANPQSLVAMIGSKWLVDKGLQVGVDYKVLAVPREDNIGRLVAEGEAKFGILSNAELRAVPERFQSKIRVTEVISEIPNFVVLANSHLSGRQIEQLKSLLQKFSNHNSFGDVFFKLTGYTALRLVSDLHMKPLDNYLAQTRKSLTPSEPAK